MTTYLVADIGGTNTRIGLVTDGTLRPDSIRRFRNADHDGLAAVLAAYGQNDTGLPLDGACVGVAGPVRDGVARMTNLDWVIDRDTLATATGAPICAVINDLQAQGHALDDLTGDMQTVVMDGPVAASNAARLVMGLGTGFNIVPVFKPDGRLMVPPAEMGHATLPARAEDADLLRYLAAHHGYPSVESALSGQGLENIFRFLGGDPAARAADIMERFTAGTDPLAHQALNLFARLLGRLAGDMALAQLPFGGIYLTGGVARAVAPHLMALGFAEAFADKGPFSTIMAEFRVSLITDDYAALRGCAHHLMQLGHP